MILTNEKIEVTHQMMERNNMTQFGKYGIPVEPKDPSKGLRWKKWADLEDADFDKLEEYFLFRKETPR